MCMMVPPTRVVIADAEPVWRLGVRQVVGAQPGMKVAADVGSVAAARETCSGLRPELLVIDVGMDGGNAFYLVEEMSRVSRATRVVIFARHVDGRLVQRALRAKACALLAKCDPVGALAEGLRRAAAGSRHLGPTAAAMLFERIASGAFELRGEAEASLSERELQVYRLMGEGYSTRAAAAALTLSIKTIETHQGRIKDKLGLGSTRELRQKAALWAGSADAA